MLATFMATQSATASSCPLDSSHEKSSKKQSTKLIQQKYVMYIMSVCHFASAGISHSVTSDAVVYNFCFELAIVLLILLPLRSMIFLAEFQIECDSPTSMQLMLLFQCARRLWLFFSLPSLRLRKVCTAALEKALELITYLQPTL